MNKPSILRAILTTYYHEKIQPAFITHGVIVTGSSRYFDDTKNDLTLHLIYRPEGFKHNIGVSISIREGMSILIETQYFVIKSSSKIPVDYYPDLEQAVIACLALELNTCKE